MSDKLKTISDIIAEMRGFKRYATSDSNDCRYVAYCCYQTFADDIEAAYKRELGNAQKLHNVMEAIHRIAYDAKSDFDVFAGIEKISRISADALAAPPRNCDVGTAEEQTERFRKFCKMDYISEDCPDDCPLYKDHSTIHCPFAWAQMSYEKEESK